MKCIKREIDRFIRCSNWVSLVTELASPDNFIMYALLSSLSLFLSVAFQMTDSIRQLTFSLCSFPYFFLLSTKLMLYVTIES